MRGIQQMPCLRNIKSIQSIGARSIPKVQRSTSYLELYMLRRKKDRLEKEIFALDKKETQQIGRWTASASELKDYKKKRTTKIKRLKPAETYTQGRLRQWL